MNHQNNWCVFGYGMRQKLLDCLFSKNVLEHKIEKLSKLILHANDDTSQHESNKHDTFVRSITITGYQK
jgi:hypothetical protein